MPFRVAISAAHLTLRVRAGSTHSRIRIQRQLTVGRIQRQLTVGRIQRQLTVGRIQRQLTVDCIQRQLTLGRIQRQLTVGLKDAVSGGYLHRAPDPRGSGRVDILPHPYIAAACASGVVVTGMTTGRDSSRYRYRGKPKDTPANQLDCECN